MKLTVNNNRIYMPADASISIEKNSPVLNDDTGTFSYPFPVPAVANRKYLAFPDRLQRTTKQGNFSFVLEEQGVQLLKGEVDIDEDVTREEIPLILKSGQTKLQAAIDDLKLSEINFGTEYLWDAPASPSTVKTKIAEWNAFNDGQGSFPGSIASVAIKNSDKVVYANKIDKNTGLLSPVVSTQAWGAYGGYAAYYSINEYFIFQFKIWWLLQTIFEKVGFTVTVNELATSDYASTVLFSNPFLVAGNWVETSDNPGVKVFLKINPANYLFLADLMPDVLVSDFLEAMQNMFCLYFDINESTGKVAIRMKKNVFAPDAIVRKNLVELDGWKHNPTPENVGYALRYESQDDSYDTEEDFEVTRITFDSELPTPEIEGEVIHFTIYDRYYVCEKDSDENLIWKRIGRLKGVVEYNNEDDDKGDLFETEINAKIPVQVAGLGAEVPQISVSLNNYQGASGVVAKLTDLYLSIYRGKELLDFLTFPLLCAEQVTLGDPALPYRPVGFDNNLQPKGLISQHSAYLYFRANAVGFTKYLKLSLTDLLALQWSKRYPVNGVLVIFDKISFDLPYNGIIEVDGYTA